MKTSSLFFRFSFCVCCCRGFSLQPGYYEYGAQASYKRAPPILNEVCETKGVTLLRFMDEVANLNDGMVEMATLFTGIQTGCKAIGKLVKRSSLPTGEPSGFEYPKIKEKRLSEIANDILKRTLRYNGRLGLFESDTEEDSDFIGATFEDSDILIEEGGKFVAIFDPLDASDNAKTGLPAGTIVGIYEHGESCDVDLDCAPEECIELEAQCLADTLQPQTNLVASAYCLYSSTTTMVLTLGNGVFLFSLDDNVGEFVLAKANVKIPDIANTYSMNESKIDEWDEAVKHTVNQWKTAGDNRQSQFSSRYVGSIVADVHRTLVAGGMFGQPADAKNPKGKMHLLYQAAPIAYLIEQAGGLSTTGIQGILSVTPEVVHQQVPVFVGSASAVQEIIDSYLMLARP